MFEYIMVFFIVSFGFIFLIYIRRKNKFFFDQKEIYLIKNDSSYTVNECLIFPDNCFIERNAMHKSKSVLVRNNVLWQSVEISQASLGGGHTHRYDTIFFKNKNTLNIRYIDNSVRYRLRRVENNTTIHSDLLNFLVKNNLGVESGSWGTVLVKNKGPFLALEVDSIVESFIKLADSYN